MNTRASARSAVEFALSHGRETDIITGVKIAVADELKNLDPQVDVRSTDYFNHSFIPDLVVRWHEAGRLTERNVYLRYTLRAASIGGDVSALADIGPIFLTLKENEDSLTRDDVKQEVSSTERVLVTDVAALDEAIAVEPPGTVSPLLSLARSNIVRGGRGLLEKTTVDELVAASAPDADGLLREANLGRFVSLIQELFVSDAAARLRRASDLIQLGVSSDFEGLLEDDSSRLIQGYLSDVELRVLLPYLLSRPEITRSSRYWNYLGSMMDLKGLEEASSELEGFDLTSLVSANISTWFASRASLVARDDSLTDSSVINDPAGEASLVEEAAIADSVGEIVHDGNEQPPLGWRMRSGILSLSLGNWRLLVASSGSKLRGRVGSLSARWADLRSALDDFELARVTLLGLARRVEVAAERDADVRADVARISDSLDDSFYVPSAAVWAPGQAGRVVVEVDFTKMLTFSASREKVTIGGIASIALRLLGYRDPVDGAEMASYLDTR